MTFDHAGHIYRLIFSYVDVTFDTKRGTHRVTLAELLRSVGEIDGKHQWELVETGSAACAPEDQFRKEDGRQLSLERLVEKICPWEVTEELPFEIIYLGDRELRGATLHAYYSRHKGRAA